ncbi:hypothetical protein SAMN05518672_102481 [Chitinophaga sp. CF118]|uniref:hypothetical protein n=1 Tax=Chitinophaga sp. CF118 TaxID=1884367 RepID=UPI0008DF4E04|nr:hypothetical protein [Chitinophaga sp. CF118]SFD57895.1 hypothetical protein SAMN05518672_102481 [Chitinophaga sp. CF118]
MKKFLLHGSIMTALIIMAVACSKDKQTPDTSFGQIKSDAFMAKYQVKAQTFTGSAATGFVVTGEKGTKITFRPNSFKDSLTGALVTGTVTIKLTEVLSKKDILLSGPMTEANGQLLISGGEINVRATADGRALVPGDSAIEVKVPQVMRAGDMNLFVQAPRKVDNNGGVPVDYPNTWVPAPYAPFGMGDNSYVFNLPAFTWVNCDRFYQDPAPKTTITVSPDFQDSDSLTGLQVMIVFSDITTVITLPFNYQLLQFQSYLNSLPVGKEGELVIIGKDENGYIEFGTQHITIAADMHIDIPIARSTEATVTAFLDSVQ